MAIDEVKTESTSNTFPPESSNHTSIFLVIFLILAGLVVGEVYSIKQIDAVHDQITAAQAKDHAALEDQISSKVSAIENSSAQALEAMKTELDQTADRMGSTGKQLQHARTLVTQLQKQQEDQANELKQELATKADQQQVGALTEDVSAAKTDLEQTKKVVNDTKS